MKKMLKMTYQNNSAYFVGNDKELNTLVETVKDFNKDATVEIIAGDLTFEQLPEDVQGEVKSILRAFGTAYVTYEYGRFNASASIGIKSNYASDHYFCGEYRAEEIYTPEERKQNFIEVFGYCPAYMK